MYSILTFRAWWQVEHRAAIQHTEVSKQFCVTVFNQAFIRCV